jgi:hypothetical protein
MKRAKMSSAAVNETLSAVPMSGDAPDPGHENLWFALARKRVRTVALVPVDVGLPVTRLAESLAEIGKRLGDHAITAITSERCDYDFVARAAGIIASTAKEGNVRPGASPLEIIVVVPPVTTEPLGLAAVQAAEAAVLCCELGRTSIEAARRTADLIGRERVLGSVVFAPR